MKLFFSEKFYNIKTKEELENLINNPKWNKIKDIIER
jgi:hypothetical protein